MAKITKMPSLARISGFKGVIDYYVHDGIPCARMWPRTPGHKRAPAVEAQWPAFRYISRAWNTISPAIQEAYRQTTAGTNLTARDLFMKNYFTPAYLKLGGSPIGDPSPNAGLFIITNIYYGEYTNGLCVTTTSDVPCHLWMHWTDKKPKGQMRFKIVRGLKEASYTRWCFVATRDIEQIQPGDTLIHTFQYKDWHDSTRRWFAFRGTIADDLSPSVSALFTYAPTHKYALYNLSFDDWPVYPGPPSFWTMWVMEGGSIEVIRDTSDPIDPPYAALVKVDGIDKVGQISQKQDITYYRYQTIKVTAWAKGVANPNNYLDVLVNGTGGWRRWQAIYDTGPWQKLEVQGTVPFDATFMEISLTAYSRYWGGGWVEWDKIQIEIP